MDYPVEDTECPENLLRYPIVPPITADEFCHEEYDGTNCWPDTALGTTYRIKCRNLPIPFPVNTSAFSTRYCNSNGTWEHSDYESCVLITRQDNCNRSDPHIHELMEYQYGVIARTKTMEVIGVSLSWLTVLMALIIFHAFRSLKCHRTKIHQHLFLAFIMRLTFDLIVLIDKKAASDDTQAELNGIKSNNPICKTLEVIGQYAKLCTFAWMFIEGVYLNSLLSSAVFRKPPFLVFYFVGWASSIPFAFAFLTAMELSAKDDDICWGTYTNNPWYIYLIELPRNSFLLVNILLLINILRVLVTKLRESNTSETRQVRKAIKATVVLLPLLGISNLVWLLPQPSFCAEKIEVILYYWIALALDSFQGFFLALLYCFLNVEVRMTLKRKWRAWRNARNPYRAHATVVTTTTDVRMSCLENHDNELLK